MTRATIIAAGFIFVGVACGDGGNQTPDSRPVDARDHDIPWDDGLGQHPDSGAGTRWEPRAPVQGGPIQETAVVALDDKVYVIGGFTDAAQEVSAVRVYDPATDSWSDAAALPMPVHHANAAVVDGTLYVLGALVTLGFTPVDNVWAYSPETDSWTEKSPIPVARGSSAIGVIDGKIYVAGGLGEAGAIDNMAVYDPATDGWTELAPLPEARDHMVGAAVDGIFYAIGGRRQSVGAITGRVDAYDPGTGEWTARAPMITPRGGAAAGVVLGAIYVAGGEGNADVDSGVFPQTEAYFPATDTWQVLPDMRTPRHGTGAAAIDNVLYVPGGADIQAFGAVATHEALIVTQL